MYWRDALSTRLRTLVETPRLGLITDMDGTISPIVKKPEDAQVTHRNRELLQALLSCLSLVAVVSGRAVADIRARLGLNGVVYVGNHGFERWTNGQVIVLPEVAAFRPALDAAVKAVREIQVPGMQIEDKTATVSIHYRQAVNPQAVKAEFTPLIQDISAQFGLDLFQGRMIFELRPPLKVNKGSAFAALVADYTLDGAIYIGDDTTDVDALRTARQLREAGRCYSLGVGVESDDMPTSVGEVADLLASGVADVESLLAWLLEARKASST